MGKLNKDWEFFGPKYRLAGAKVARVDCKFCQMDVSAVTNRLKTHLRVCAGLALWEKNNQQSTKCDDVQESLPGVGGHPDTSLSDAIASDLAECISVVATEQVSTGGTGNNARKQLQSKARSSALDEPLFDIVRRSTMTPAAAQSTATNRLLEGRRLQLEIKRQEREERREELELEILEAKVRQEKLLVEKREYEVKVALARSRKSLRDEGVEEKEINWILPLSTSQMSRDRREVAASSSGVLSFNQH